VTSSGAAASLRSVETPFPVPTPGLVVGEKYRIEREIGRGGMGAVYLVHHVALDQTFAMKVLTTEAGQATQRFLREARAAARLESAHVVRVIDVGMAEHVGPYLVMELLDGTDLSEVVSTEGPLDSTHAVDAVLETCDALAEAHSLGIVHRDLKPANLFRVKRADGSTAIKVLDFGISKVEPLSHETQKLTETQGIMGSPHYMSPEQLRSSHDVDARADIWSLGVVLFELLTGTVPFDGKSVGAVFADILEKPAPRVRAIRANVPERLDAIVARCLERKPEDRFQTAGDLALALAPFGSSKSSNSVARAARFGSTLPSVGVHVVPKGHVASAVSATEMSPAKAHSGLWRGLGIGSAAVALFLAASIVGMVASPAQSPRVSGSAVSLSSATASGATVPPTIASAAPPASATVTPLTVEPVPVPSVAPTASTKPAILHPRSSGTTKPTASPAPSSFNPDLDRRR
jgi:serine/threonine protein kinase